MRNSMPVLVGWLLLSACLNTAAWASGPIAWLTDVREAQHLATQQQRLILLHFWDDNCPPCRRLEENVFPQPQVVEALQTSYVPVKVKVRDMPHLRRLYNVTSWPTDVITTPDGEELFRAISNQDPDRYVALLNRVAMNHRVGVPETQLAARSKAEVVQASAESLGDYPPGNLSRSTQYAPPQSYQQPGYQQPGYQQPGDRAGMPPQGTAPGGPESGRDSWGQRHAQDAYGQAAPDAPRWNNSPPTNQGPYAPQSPFDPQANRVNTYDAYQEASGNRSSTYGGSFQPQGMQGEPRQPAPNSWQAGIEAPAAPPAQNTMNPYLAQQAVAGQQNSSWSPSADRASSYPANYAAAGGSFPNQAGRAGIGPTMPDTGPAANQPPGSSPAVAMDGFCPVSLIERQQWVKADPRWGVEHRGQVYLFSSPAEQQKFLAEPDRYSPVLSGCDPVRFAETGALVSGKRQHGVSYRNQIYLFADEAALDRFWKAPENYAATVYRAMQQAGPTRR
ncbi:MAG: DUF255 domain-containing protein [Pirellulaceae bacterium]|nr:DUF255 domain-containing protein [Pirellulaceae bacterium]